MSTNTHEAPGPTEQRLPRRALTALAGWGRRRLAFALVGVIALAAAIGGVLLESAVFSGSETIDEPVTVSPSLPVVEFVDEPVVIDRATLWVLDSFEASEPLRPAPIDGFAWPASGVLVQGMTTAHPLGVDIDAPRGTPIQAVMAGEVTFAGGDACCSYGLYVIVAHGDGWTSLYGHLSSIDVKEGDTLRQSEIVGLAGDTGKATGAHLHFELSSFGALVDPLLYLLPRRYVAAPPADSGASGLASVLSSAGEVPAEPEIDLSFRRQAVRVATLWMETQEQDAAYGVVPGSCTAEPVGPNWTVSCATMFKGCDWEEVCGGVLTVCVFEQSLLVADTACTGYK